MVLLPRLVLSRCESLRTYNAVKAQQTQESHLQERHASLRQHPALRSGYREIFVHPIAPRRGGAQVSHCGRAKAALFSGQFVAALQNHETKQKCCLERRSLFGPSRQFFPIPATTSRKNLSLSVHCCGRVDCYVRKTKTLRPCCNCCFANKGVRDNPW